jgi:flagellar biogenesis protein FliO
MASGTIVPVEAASTAAHPAASAASQAIPFKSEAGANAQGVGFPAAVFICLAVFAVAVVILRRWSPRIALRGSPRRAVEVIGSARLGDRTRVSVVRFRGRELLVAHSEHAITVLARERVDAVEETGA